MKSSKFANSTINIKEAAEFLGFRSTERLRQKVKKGLIPGAKPGREWVFLKEDLVKYLRDSYTNDSTYKNSGGLCLFQKQRIKNTIKQDSQSVELECKNLRNQLREQRLKNTKR